MDAASTVMIDGKTASCDACGRVRPNRDAIWFTVHFGLSDTSLMIHATGDDLRRCRETHACSRECLQTIVDRWALIWHAKKAAHAS